MKIKIRTAVILAAIMFINASAFSQMSDQKSAKLIVYRKGCAYGLLAHYKVKEDDKQLGVLGNKSIYTYDITPGSHTISPRQQHRAIMIDVKPGQTYVVKYKTRIGIFGARPKLKLMTVDEAKADSKFFAEHMNDKMSM